MPTKIDTNIENYTISELLTILDLDQLDLEQVNEKTDYYIEKFTKENDPDMTNFFRDIKYSLIDYVKQLDNDDADDSNETVELKNAKKQSALWYQNEVFKQKDKVQNDKVTDRKQKISVFNNSHVPMNREHLGVSNTFDTPVAQDVLNPNLKNVTSRIIVLDSQYRQSNNPNESASDYTLDLSEPLLNVLSLRLYSFSIPYTWYTIDTIYGNTCFWLTIPTTSAQDPANVKISIDPGNYTTSTIVSALTDGIKNAGVDFSGNISAIPSIPGSAVPVYINPNNGKIILNLFGAKYNYKGTILTINESTIITFFDPTFKLDCNLTNVDVSYNIPCTNPNTIAINQTLGWVLGYRVPVQNIKKNGNPAIAIPDLYGPKYFILVIDDLNQNHINNGLIGITETSRVLKLPSYYSPDLPYTCVPANPKGTDLSLNSLILENDTDSGTLIVDKFNASYSATPRILPSAPRILTQSQIYSINEIIKNNEKTYNYKLKAPVVSDTFAILPIKLGSMKIGDVNVEFGGSMQDNKRIYFGPVNISRLRIKLLDDRGNIVNLNGCDWCVTIISENLYQY
jgi:hypothetical protein